MLIRLFKQARAVRQSLSGRRKGVDEKIPIGHIAVYTLAICSFHFLCWTPYWVSVLYSLYVEIFNPNAMLETPSFKFIYFMYGVHALPYINSASNFILYGLLNRQLHQSPDRKYTRNGGAATAPTLRISEYSEMINQQSVCPRESAVSTRSPTVVHIQKVIQQATPIAPATDSLIKTESCSGDEDSIVI